MYIQILVLIRPLILSLPMQRFYFVLTQIYLRFGKHSNGILWLAKHLMIDIWLNDGNWLKSIASNMRNKLDFHIEHFYIWIYFTIECQSIRNIIAK